MFMIKYKARRKDARRHIAAKSLSPSDLFDKAKNLSERYDVEIWYNNRVEWVYDRAGNKTHVYKPDITLPQPATVEEMSRRHAEMNANDKEKMHMTKAEVIALAKKYNMVFARDPITDEANGVMCESEDLIPELDLLADGDDRDTFPVTVTRTYYGVGPYHYRVYCPTAWIDLWGWR